MTIVRIAIIFAVITANVPTNAADNRPESMTFVGVVDDKGLRERTNSTLPDISTVTIDVGVGRIAYGINRFDFNSFSDLVPCSDSAWYCLRDLSFNFAIPSAWSGNPASWIYQGVEYRVLNTFLSRQGSTIHISAQRVDTGQPEPGRPSVYLYDVNRGLVGYHTMLSGVGGVLIPVTYVRVSEASLQGAKEGIEGSKK